MAIANPRRHHRRRYRMNPHRRRHYRRNPFSLGSLSPSRFGLPSFKSIAYGGMGFVLTAAIANLLDTYLVPTSWKTNSDGSPSMLVKYAEIAAGIALGTVVARQVDRAAAVPASVGGGAYAFQAALKDFFPTFVTSYLPGLHAYTPLRAGMGAYTPLRPGMGRYVATGGGGMPQLAARYRFGMPGLAAQDIGGSNLPVGWAADGAMDVVSQRFRRFN